MKILIVCQYYHPENFQITPICEQLAADGIDVTVLTGLPNYPMGVVPEEYRKGHRDEMINGVHVLRCHEVGRKKGAVHLGLNYVSFLFSAMRKVRTLPDDFDLVFVYQLSPVLMGLPGRAYARKHGIPLFLYCCDLWPESMKMYLKSESSPLFQMVKRVSRRVYASCTRIACQSSSFLPYLHRVHGIPMEKMMYLPAFADESYLEADFAPQDDTVDLVFLGNMGIAQDLMRVLAALNTLKDLTSLRVHFVGDGAVREEMERYVRKNGLSQMVWFYGRRGVEEMPKFYKLADACLVSLRADNETGLTLPSKVQGYMAAGKAVIGMIDGSAKEVIEESGCGLCVRAGDTAGLAAAIRSFVEEPERYRDCGENARRYFRQHFTKRNFMMRLENELKRMR